MTALKGTKSEGKVKFMTVDFIDLIGDFVPETTIQTALIPAITTLTGSVATYLKVNSDRKVTGQKRDTDFELLCQRVTDHEKKLDEIREVKEAVSRIDKALTRIETILEVAFRPSEITH